MNHDLTKISDYETLSSVTTILLKDNHLLLLCLGMIDIFLSKKMSLYRKDGLLNFSFYKCLLFHNTFPKQTGILISNFNLHSITKY